MTDGHAFDEGPLTDQLRRLTAEVRVLRRSVDDLTTVLEWAAQNGRLPAEFDRAVHHARPPPTLELFETGDAVTFEVSGGKEGFGEIVALDDARNLADVQTIPSGEILTLIQDRLTRVGHDPLSHRRLPDEKGAGDVAAPPAPGRLF